ncbi:MAG: hypothetical protein DSZ23_06430 [Thermodesulfatator sp.]|nr:MAG: hypothetical protein DSZ23_06430 [Thermodesulfatator sp.]
MRKSLFYYFFRLGKFPDSDALKATGPVIMDEGIKITVTFKNYRSTGKFFYRKRNWYSGSVAITAERFLVFIFSKKVLDISLQDPRFEKMDVYMEGKNCLVIGFDASLFQRLDSGRVEYRLFSPLAGQMFRQLSNPRLMK